jgi:hypothetical protein
VSLGKRGLLLFHVLPLLGSTPEPDNHTTAGSQCDEAAYHNNYGGHLCDQCGWQPIATVLFKLEQESVARTVVQVSRVDLDLVGTLDAEFEELLSSIDQVFISHDLLSIAIADDKHQVFIEHPVVSVHCVHVLLLGIKLDGPRTEIIRWNLSFIRQWITIGRAHREKELVLVSQSLLGQIVVELSRDIQVW